MEGLVGYLSGSQLFFFVGVVHFFNQRKLLDSGIRAAVVAEYKGPACNGIFCFWVILDVVERIFHVEDFPFPVIDWSHGLIRVADITGTVSDSLGAVLYL